MTTKRSMRRKAERTEGTISDLLSDAVAEIESLADEMEEWYSNMDGTGLEATSVYEAVEDAAQALRQLYGDVESLMSDIEALEGFDVEQKITFVQYLPYSRHKSRANRLAWAEMVFAAVQEAIGGATRDMAGQDEEGAGGTGGTGGDGAASFNDVSDGIDALDFDVEIPGMYGR